MNYIDGTVFNWEHPQAQEILRVCSDSYREVHDIRYLIQRTKGLDDREFGWIGVGAKDIWREILFRVGEDGNLRALIEKMLSDPSISAHHANLKHLFELPGSAIAEDRGDVEPPLPEALAGLLEIIQRGDLESSISPDLLRAARACQPSTLVAYRVQRIAYLLQARFAIDKRFISLTLTINQADQIRPWEFSDLQDVLVALPDYPVLILLGAPGAGKSTLLWRLERDLNEAALRETNATQLPLPFYVSLNRYPPIEGIENSSSPDGIEWLADQWKKRLPKMPTLNEIMETCPVLLLLDGLNEMPYTNRSQYNLMTKEWRALAASLETSNHRLLFSCRNLDYTGSLSTPELPVPQVQVQPLSPEKISSFIKVYLPEHATTIWTRIKDSPSLLATLSTPFFLHLLVEQAAEKADVPTGQAALISGFVKKALRREVEHENWPFRPGELLSQRDCDNILRTRSSPPHVIPGGQFIKKLCTLAYEMQAGSQRADGGQVRIDFEEAQQLIGDADAELILRAGVSLGVIDEDLESMDLLNYHETVAFKHQLFQEYFAARTLAEMDAESLASLVYTSWREDCVEESLIAATAALSVGEPLPSLPQTGWEESVTLAAAMVPRPDQLLSALITANLPLAARCAAQSDVGVSVHLKKEIQRLLVDRSRDVNADLRHRISVGLALGHLGDPRFESRRGPYGDYLLPPMVLIPGGVFLIGSEEKEADEDERDGPYVELDAFSIGQFPVTNAEWGLFMKAGGYEDQQWWVTDDGRAWWLGESVAMETKKRLREEKAWLMSNYHRLQQFNEVSIDVIELCRLITEMDEVQFEAILEEKFPVNRYRQPRHWSNRLFNNPSQPVVGVCLHEAKAYCSWLSAQTNQLFLLPTEFQWEAAARGLDRRTYAHGDEYDPMCFNVLDTRIGCTTPVGVFPNGDTPDGLSDMIGNCWEWTTSAYKPYSNRRTETSESYDSKIVRRGSWYGGARNIRASSRYWNSPNRRNDYLGFRLVCSVTLGKNS